ncbi:MAG: hypothetical protein JWR26_4166 [Pedosphaera sp.]|nr:hypothetical protein [Pedosphaera sp.]
MKKLIKIALFILAVVAVALVLVRSSSPNPVAVIRVVDIAGKPIPGAIIRPDGLRPKRINSHHGWTDEREVKPTPVVTDAQGIARVPYPRYVFEKTETGQISFGVEHTNYCSDRPFRVVSAAPPANATLKDKAGFLFMLVTKRVVTRPDPVVLKLGGIAKVSGYLGSKENLIPQIHPQLDSMTLPRKGFWVSENSASLMNRRIPEGANALRLVYLPPSGRVCFSDAVYFAAIPGQTNEFCLELKPGIRLSARLDNSVPRPVINGRVQVSVTSQPTNTSGKSVSWRAWKTVNPDGTFSFDSLPPGKAEVIAMCDGFKSKDGAVAKISDFCMPQVFQLNGADIDGAIAMEPTANFEATILDDKGQPLADAGVFFWPNVIWNGVGSTIFMGPTYNAEDVLRSGEEINWQKIRTNTPPLFQARSDKHGIALVRNLPAFKQSFAVDHTSYELPVTAINNDRQLSTQLSPSETNHVTVTLQKKGTQFLKSPR